MAKGIYIGENNLAKKVKKMYIGVNGVARKVKKAYIGVNGVARQFYSSAYYEKISKSIFDNNATDTSSTVALNNGNFIIFYAQSSYLKFKIISENGSIIKEEPNFASGGINSVAIKLNNGNIFVVYNKGYSARFQGVFIKIIDSSGNIIKNEYKIFNSKSQAVCATKLNNGNVFIAYQDSDGHKGAFKIFNENGTQVVGSNIFSKVSPATMSATTLLNGNVFISYSNLGKFRIYDENGNQIKSETSFGSGSAYNISSALFKNGNILVAYRDATNSEKGAFVIYNQNGELVKGNTFFADKIWYNSSLNLEDGNVLIAYENKKNPKGEFVIYDSQGNLVKENTVFNETDVAHISSTLANGNKVIVSYNDHSNSKGSYVFIE